MSRALQETKKYGPFAIAVGAANTFALGLPEKRILTRSDETVVFSVEDRQGLPRSILPNPMANEIVKIIVANSQLTGYVVDMSTFGFDPDPKIGAANVPIYRISALRDGGMSEEQIAEDFPSLTREQIDWAIAYAQIYPNYGKQYPKQSLKRLLRKSGFHRINKELADLKKTEGVRGRRSVSSR
jgi:uncharacterized protein (DUF433 family)